MKAVRILIAIAFHTKDYFFLYFTVNVCVKKLSFVTCGLASLNRLFSGLNENMLLFKIYNELIVRASLRVNFTVFCVFIDILNSVNKVFRLYLCC